MTEIVLDVDRAVRMTRRFSVSGHTVLVPPGVAVAVNCAFRPADTSFRRFVETAQLPRPRDRS